MTDNTELKRLAEAAPEGPWFGPEYAPGTSYVFDVDLGTLLAYESIDSEKDACLRYVAAANPAAVLALIADNDRLNAENKQLILLECHCGTAQAAINLLAERDQLKAELEKAELIGRIACNFDGYKAVLDERDQLKAEIEALRKDAERYRRMRSAALKQDDVLADEFDAEFDLQLDAALGKEAQS